MFVKSNTNIHISKLKTSKKMSFKATIDTTSGEYLTKRTKERIDALCEKYGTNRQQLINCVLEQCPELKDKKNQVHQSIYGNQAYPYIFELMENFVPQLKTA